MASSMASLKLRAPVSGILVPLETVPDPVFAGKMVWDGIAIDPTSEELRAPLAGTVIQLHAAAHAVTIRGEGGLEVLLHIGLDTVKLRGQGFTPLVREGEQVTMGQVLIRFKADEVARQAKSLLTEMVVAGGPRVSAIRPGAGLVQAAQDVVLEVELAEGNATGAPAGAEGGTATAGPVRLPNPAGLHARPAAVLAAEAKRFSSDVRILKGERGANAKSVVALLGLGTALGDALLVEATGPDAREAADAVAKLLGEGCGEGAGEPLPPVSMAAVRGVASDADEMAGVSASPGLAVGRSHRLRLQAIEVAERGESLQRERTRLDAALAQARAALAAVEATLRDPARSQITDRKFNRMRPSMARVLGLETRSAKEG